MPPLNILITGHTGFIGKAFWKHLRNYPEQYKLFGHDKSNSIYDLDRIFEKNKLDLVIHLGADSNTSNHDILDVFQSNVAYSTRLFHLCAAHKVRVQYASSASVYGNCNPTFSEDGPVEPLCPYAWSKIAMEYAARGFWGQTVLQGFRYFNVYGPGEDHKGNQASPYHKFRKELEQDGRITLFKGSKEFRRDFIPVEELIQQQLKMMSIGRSGVWNIGTGKTKSFYDVALETGGPKVKIRWINMPKALESQYQKYTCANRQKYLLDSSTI